MLEKQLCSGKIIISFHIQVYVIKTLALYSQKAHHSSVTKTSFFKVYTDTIVHCKSCGPKDTLWINAEFINVKQVVHIVATVF